MSHEYDISTLAGQFEFLCDYPDWSPLLSADGRVIAMASPGFPTEAFKTEEPE